MIFRSLFSGFFSFDFLKHEIINNFRWFRVQGSSHESLTLQHIGELKRQLCHLVSSFQSMSPAGEAKVIKKKSWEELHAAEKSWDERGCRDPLFPYSKPVLNKHTPWQSPVWYHMYTIVLHPFFWLAFKYTTYKTTLWLKYLNGKSQ